MNKFEAMRIVLGVVVGIMCLIKDTGFIFTALLLLIIGLVSVVTHVEEISRK